MITRNTNTIYVGVDTHKGIHVAVAINQMNQQIGTLTIKNKPSEFEGFLKYFKNIDKNSNLVFGLEDTGDNGRNLARYLIDNGQIVKEVNAASAAIFRSQANYKKNDEFDARCVALAMLMQWETLKDVHIEDQHWTLKQLVSQRDSFVESKTKVRHKLHEVLKHSYPSYDRFFSDIFGKGALHFWDTYPSPKHLENVSVEELAIELRKGSRNSLSTRKAKQIKELIESDGHMPQRSQDNSDFVIRSNIKMIRVYNEVMKEIEDKIKITMKELGYKLETMPGIDTVLASKIVSEIGDIDRFRSPDKLAKFAGIAPYEHSSGGKSNFHKSKQGNRTLHKAFYNLAVQQVQVSKKGDGRNPVFREYYLKKQSEGKTKGQALVCVMRRLVSIIFGMMRTKTEYRHPVPKTAKAELKIAA